MCDVHRRRERFRDERLVRLSFALGPLAGHRDCEIPVTFRGTCLFGHRVSIPLVPAEWEAASRVSPPDLTKLRSTTVEGRQLLDTGLCGRCPPNDPINGVYQ